MVHGTIDIDIDIDVNVFVGVHEAPRVFGVLPDAVDRNPTLLEGLRRDGQVRLWSAQTPVDLFLSRTSYHGAVAGRVRWERFMGRSLRFLPCNDLAVFKAFLDRTKDRADLEEMAAAGTIDTGTVAAVRIEMLGEDDERVPRLMALSE